MHESSYQAAGCRVCGAGFHPPLLTLPDMPAAAQGFPGADELAADRGTTLDILQCQGCGLVQLACPPVPYYRDVIRASAFSAEMRDFRRAQLGDWVQAHGLQGKRVLEVGAGRGEYLALLRDAGARAVGIEHGAASVAAAREQGLDVRAVYVDGPACRVDAEPFDAFASFNFMEHWPQPVASLRGIAQNLVDGGVGLVEVPNFDMIVEKQLYSEFIADHLSYFTADTLRFALQAAGFEVLELSSIWYDYILSARVRKRPALSLQRFARQQQQVTASIHGYIDRFGDGRVAVWGAGHQALAVLALAGLQRRVRYVVDSAPFKQGRYTPATHLPICAPEQLDRDPVPAVIVMAAGYSDEVARIVRQRWGSAMHVAVLREDGVHPC